MVVNTQARALKAGPWGWSSGAHAQGGTSTVFKLVTIEEVPCVSISKNTDYQ